MLDTWVLLVVVLCLVLAFPSHLEGRVVVHQLSAGSATLLYSVVRGDRSSLIPKLSRVGQVLCPPHLIQQTIYVVTHALQVEVALQDMWDLLVLGVYLDLAFLSYLEEAVMGHHLNVKIAMLLYSASL